MRTLNDDEMRVLMVMVNELPQEERKRLVDDISTALMSTATPDGSRLLFHLPGYLRPTYRGQHAYPVEGTMKDVDDCDLSVRLYADENERVLELEIIKWGEAQLISPRWETFMLSVVNPK